MVTILFNLTYHFHTDCCEISLPRRVRKRKGSIDQTFEVRYGTSRVFEGFAFVANLTVFRLPRIGRMITQLNHAVHIRRIDRAIIDTARLDVVLADGLEEESKVEGESLLGILISGRVTPSVKLFAPTIDNLGKVGPRKKDRVPEIFAILSLQFKEVVFGGKGHQRDF